MSELLRHFESPEDDDRPRRPDDPPDPPRDLGLIDRVAQTLGAEPRSPTVFDRMSVIDRLAGPAQTRDAPRQGDGRFALEALCRDLGGELHDKVPQDTWKTANEKQRAELARKMHVHIRERYGLGEGELIVSSELDEDTMGEFTGGKVFVSERLLSDSTPHELIDTIAHENEHALQEEITSGRRAHPLGTFAAAEVDAWREGQENYNPEDLMGKGYTYNPLEVDSRHAGVMVVEGYLKAEIAAQSEQIEQLKAQAEQVKAQAEQVKALEEDNRTLKADNQTLKADLEELRTLVEKLAADRGRPAP